MDDLDFAALPGTALKEGGSTCRGGKKSQPPAFSGNSFNLADHDYGTVASPDGKKSASPGVDPPGDEYRFRHAGLDRIGSSGRTRALFDFRRPRQNSFFKIKNFKCQ